LAKQATLFRISRGWLEPSPSDGRLAKGPSFSPPDRPPLPYGKTRTYGPPRILSHGTKDRANSRRSFPPHSRGLAPRSSCYRNSSPPAFKRPTCPELCSPSALFWEEGLWTIPLGNSTWSRAAAFHLTVFLPAAPRLPETPRYGERQFAFLPRPTQSEREQSQVLNQRLFRQTLPQRPQSWQRPFFALLLSDPCHVPSRAQATTFLLTCPLASDTLRGGEKCPEPYDNAWRIRRRPEGKTLRGGEKSAEAPRLGSSVLEGS
jgi:hypothetical protein